MSPIKRESVDIDGLFNFDQNLLASSTPAKQNALQAPDFRPNVQHQPFVPSSQPSFTGPSFQYDLYPQQTGIPAGSLAKSFPITQLNDFDITGGDGIFDFNAFASQNGSNDTEMDFDSPSNEWTEGSDGGFVDPNAIGGQEGTSPVQQRAEVVKFWPGMHTKQAEQAELAKLSHQRQRQQPKPVVPSNAGNSPVHKRNGSKSAGYRHDPRVEQRISQLLNDMRRNSDAKDVSGPGFVQAAGAGSSNANSQDSQALSNSQPQSNNQKSKKPEEDMDEDERLLASEEGKKLSSKERRQLRNKVSARAFRSRRKEYIGQLESELNQKAQENDKLRNENENLKVENNRLTDLTKMLLASPAFAGFVDELAANGIHQLPAALQSVKQEQQQQQQQPQQPKPQQQQAPAPEMTVDMSTIAPAGGNWGTGIDFDFDQQVFAVTELPEVPAFDAELLSGKAAAVPELPCIDTEALSGKQSSSPALPPVDFAPAKNELPRVEATSEPEAAEEPEQATSDEELEATPALALYASPSAPAASQPELKLFGEIPLEKALARIELTVEGEEQPEAAGEVSAATMARFNMLCENIDGVIERLAAQTSRL